MPATIVHSYFAKDTLEILPSSIVSMVDDSRVRMFSQSMDSLMFYNLFSPLPGKKIRKFTDYFHRNKTQQYFVNLINYIKNNDLINDTDVASFLVGSICHYVLDSTVHPFIVYKTGVFDKKQKNTYKYNNIHTFMETFLDNDMVARREDINPYRFKMGSFCFNTHKFSEKLDDCLDHTFYDTFQIKNMSKIYYKSLKQMKSSLVVFRRDPVGFKKFFYKLADTFTTKKVFRFEAISYHYPLEDKHNFLNLNHQLWRNPVIYNVTSNESFLDLYLKALKIAKVLICASFDYINGKNIELEKIYTNISYVTGVNCDIEKEIKYFEF